jgi:hypothetical protein
VPYVFNFVKSGRQIVYFGANHSPDPNNKQYPRLLKRWAEFIQATKNAKRAVLVETSIIKPAKNPNEAIRLGAESALMQYLAKKERVKIHCPEPSFSEQAILLLKDFSKEEVEYYFFAQVVVQWHRYAKKPDFEKYAKRFLDMDKKEFKWKDFDFTLDNIKVIHKSIFKNNLNHESRSFFRQIISPASNKTVINRIARQNNLNRERGILQKIEDIWKQGNNLFIVYGYSHAVVQKAAIKEIVKS